MEIFYFPIVFLFVCPKLVVSRSIQGDLYNNFKDHNYNKNIDNNLDENDNTNNKLSNHVIKIQRKNGDKNDTKTIRFLKVKSNKKLELACIGVGYFKWFHDSTAVNQSDEVDVVDTISYDIGTRTVMMTKNLTETEDMGLYECLSVKGDDRRGDGSRSDGYDYYSINDTDYYNGRVNDNNLDHNDHHYHDHSNIHHDDNDHYDNVDDDENRNGDIGAYDFIEHYEEYKACGDVACDDEVEDDEGVMVMVDGYVVALKTRIFVEVGASFHLVCLKSQVKKRLEWLREDGVKIEFENQTYQITEEEVDDIIMSVLKVSNVTENECGLYVCRPMSEDSDLGEEDYDDGVEFYVNCLKPHNLTNDKGDDEKIPRVEEMDEINGFNVTIENISLSLRFDKKEFSTVVGESEDSKKILKIRLKRQVADSCIRILVLPNTVVTCTGVDDTGDNITVVYPENQQVLLTKVGTQCIFTCTNGLWLSDKTPINCVQQGTNPAAWDLTYPTCSQAVLMCPKFIVPKDMTAVCWFDASSNPDYHVNETTYSPNDTAQINWEGSKCRFTCLNNLILYGDSIIECRQSANRTADYEEMTLPTRPTESIPPIYLDPMLYMYPEYNYSEYDKINEGGVGINQFDRPIFLAAAMPNTISAETTTTTSTSTTVLIPTTAFPYDANTKQRFKKQASAPQAPQGSTYLPHWAGKGALCS